MKYMLRSALRSMSAHGDYEDMVSGWLEPGSKQVKKLSSFMGNMMYSRISKPSWLKRFADVRYKNSIIEWKLDLTSGWLFSQTATLSHLLSNPGIIFSVSVLSNGLNPDTPNTSRFEKHSFLN